MRAPLDNPLASYEEYAKRYGIEKTFFAILSPRFIAAPGWSSVTYDCYCAALRRSLPSNVFGEPSSKWDVFAREFIVHLEIELKYHHTKMTEDQLALVEANLLEIEAVEALYKAYREHTSIELQRRLHAAVPEYKFLFSELNWKYGAVETLREGRISVDLLFQIPIQKGGNSLSMYRVAADLKGLSLSELEYLKNKISMDFSIDRGWYSWEESFNTRAEAMDGLCSLCRVIFALPEF